MNLFEEFKNEFAEHLCLSQRWDAFLFIAQKLLNKTHALYILETGCVHERDDWEGQGQSTILWNWLCHRTNGASFSIDISQEHCEIAQELAPQTFIICQDSISYLSEFEMASNVDLLYLDSLDHNPPFALSELHHAGELASIYNRLSPGCLIAIDDCKSDNHGKHYFVKLFFDKMGIEPLFKGYVTIWEKP